MSKSTDGRLISVIYAEISYETTWNIGGGIGSKVILKIDETTHFDETKRTLYLGRLRSGDEQYALSILAPKITSMFLKHAILYICIDLLFLN